jgi:hypothetical protein
VHDANGKAVVKTDERLAAVGRLGRPHIAGCEIWSTDRMPVDNSEESEAAQRKGFVTRYNYVGTAQIPFMIATVGVSRCAVTIANMAGK